MEWNPWGASDYFFLFNFGFEDIDWEAKDRGPKIPRKFQENENSPEDRCLVWRREGGYPWS